MSKVAVDAAGCWNWTGALMDSGYGRFRMGSASYYAHRASYTLFVGPIPPGSRICHSCDNPSCVNPAHLWPGSDADNVADKVTKGRARGGGALLDEHKVREIRERSRRGESTPTIAADYGVGRSTITSVVNRVNWAWVD